MFYFENLIKWKGEISVNLACFPVFFFFLLWKIGHSHKLFFFFFWKTVETNNSKKFIFSEICNTTGLETCISIGISLHFSLGLYLWLPNTSALCQHYFVFDT